jgi:hypothetical protein
MNYSLGNINSSLMVLRQCFETLRENQAQGLSKVNHSIYKTKMVIYYLDGTIS